MIISEEELKNEIREIAKHFHKYKTISHEMFEKGEAPWEGDLEQKRQRHNKQMMKRVNRLIDKLQLEENNEQ